VAPEILFRLPPRYAPRSGRWRPRAPRPPRPPSPPPAGARGSPPARGDHGMRTASAMGARQRDVVAVPGARRGPCWSSRISPEPHASIRRAHATASRPVGRPPAVGVHLPLSGPARHRRASIPPPCTAPNRSAARRRSRIGDCGRVDRRPGGAGAGPESGRCTPTAGGRRRALTRGRGPDGWTRAVPARSLLTSMDRDGTRTATTSR